MKYIQLIILSLLFTYCPIVFSKEIKIENIEKKYHINVLIKKYHYTVSKNQLNEQSFSSLKNGCDIQLSDNNKPLLMKNKEKEFEFTYLHEISHCILGKNVLYKNIDWKIDIEDHQKVRIESLIMQNEQLYINNNKTPLIKVIYHEIFADTLATMLYMKYNKNSETDINILLKNRKLQNLNPYDTHLSVTAIENVLKEREKIKYLTIEKLKDKAIKITQEQILQYIRVEYE